MRTIMHLLRAVTRRLPGATVALVFCLVAATAAQKPGEYVVGPNDQLAVNVFNQPKHSGTFPVGVDGTFSMPFIGTVVASGRTVQSISDEIKARLAKDYLKDPQLAISVEQYRSQQVVVTGAVRTPQTIEFKGALSLLEALTKAGNLNENAGQEAQIIRSSNGAAVVDKANSSNDPNTIRVDLEKLLRNADLSLNVPLRGGDTIIVAEAETVFVSGEVARVGKIVIRRGMTVQEALTLAGGITSLGTDKRIEITRTVNGKKDKIDGKLDDRVLPGDFIIVKKRFF